MKRGGWRSEALAAVEAVKMTNGEKFERRDIVHELATRHPDVPNRRIQGAVNDHLVKGPDGRYELRPQSRRWAPRSKAISSIPPLAIESVPWSGARSPTILPASTPSLDVPSTSAKSHPLLDYIFECPKCGEALIIGKPECPGTNCKEVVDWTEILTKEFLTEVVKEL